ncbi:hypothetical protein CP967_17560 [Streptomyces nitrosporeus]|uniref:Integral membrane protein n=1 Tax=Streptomyces nitrosporeus TaxID=28894 RepID=A0A5J6FDI9_9ACTN|nr:hypothetical protein [Streptomyces nitrosporeus]QEU73564.1 hypothetical protein CP967_17560 [Streptomyces nitrosporeus]GGZ03612.1 hypothetical protein GCM10010327_37530 [Streptomyces nitrosporeus]
MRTYLSTALSAVLLILLALLVPVSALAAWVDLEIDDTDRYLAAVSPLASDSDVQDTIASLITDEVMENIDLGPLQDALDDFLRETARSFTTTEAFQRAWDSANRTAHETVTEALREDDGQAVTIDLAPVIERVRQDLTDRGVPFAEQIPVQHLTITLLSADRADELRSTFRWLRYCSVWPAVATAVLLVAVTGLAFVRGGRRRGLGTVAVAGAGLALGAVLLRVAVALGRSRALDQVPGSDRDAAAAVYDALTASLRTTVWAVLAAGLALLVCGVAGRLLTGRGPTHRPAPRPR